MCEVSGFTPLPMKMELTEGSETSAYTNQTPGNYPKGNLLYIYIYIYIYIGDTISVLSVSSTSLSLCLRKLGKWSWEEIIILYVPDSNTCTEPSNYDSEFSMLSHHHFQKNNFSVSQS